MPPAGSVFSAGMDKRTSRKSEANPGAPEHWGLDPQDVRRHARRMREAKSVSPLGKTVRVAAVAALLAGAFAVFWNFETLRELRLDFSRVTGAFEDAAEEVEDARRGGELETETVGDTSIAGVRMETSLEGETPPPAETPQGAAPEAAAPAAETPAADAPAPAAAAVVEPAPPVAAPPAAEPAERAAVREEPRPVAPPEPEVPAGPETFGFGLEVMNVSEADASARVLVLRDGGRRGVSTIRWWTTDGAAVAGSDFARLEPRTERFGVGEQNRTLLIPIIGDRNPEGPESFFVHIAVGDSTEAVARIEVVINDDD
jgi:hypothetical protein